MCDKYHVCSYSHCLHPGNRVKESEAVVVGRKYYHWDCADMKDKIKECVDTYMDLVDDKTKYPIVVRIINNMVFKNRVPAEYILKKLNSSKSYYSDKPIYALYGIRKIYWEYEVGFPSNRSIGR